MNKKNTIIYTKIEKNFISKLHNEIPRVKTLWKEHVESWGEMVGKTFNADLNYFVDVVTDAVMNNELKLATKILNKIEVFLKNSDEELEEAITIFFFETLTNRLGHEEEKYMENFTSLLGPYSKECCRKLDKFWGTITPGVDCHTKNPNENRENNNEEIGSAK